MAADLAVLTLVVVERLRTGHRVIGRHLGFADDRIEHRKGLAGERLPGVGTGTLADGQPQTGQIAVAAVGIGPEAQAGANSTGAG